MLETLDVKEYIKEPLQDNLQTLFNHLGRYYYAIEKLNINRNDNVLDVGCGQGYGSYLLSQFACYVFAVEKNLRFVKKAKESFNKSNIVFYHNNYPGVNINKIVCIEVIEHMNKNKQKAFLEELFSGTEEQQLYLTFPIGKNKPSKYNKYHKCEPSVDFIYNIVKKYFKKIEIEIDQFTNNYGHNQEYCIMVAK